MLILSEQDVLASVTCADMVAAVEESFLSYEKKDFTMPHRMHIDHGNNTLLLMPCFGRDYFSTKLVSVFPGNAGTEIPVVNGVVVLNDMNNGEPLALINGRVLTALRTGAVGAVGIRHLSPANALKAGIVGTGVQALYQVLSAATVRELTDLYILATRPEKGQAFADRVGAYLPALRTHVVKSAEELLTEAEIIITATTSSNPVLPENESLLAGKHFVGVGSFKPDVREFPDSLYRLIDKIYVDVDHAATESGDVVWPLKQGWIAPDRIETLGSFILNEKEKEKVRQNTTFYKSVGMALFDLFAARMIYAKAVEKGLGLRITL
jgi:ornithine cyclodeaminase/alanine dehydrogenase-like protein (mu-crystallin family)